MTHITILEDMGVWEVALPTILPLFLPNVRTCAFECYPAAINNDFEGMMPDLNLTQAEADALLAMEKHRVDERHWTYPGMGGRIEVPLISASRRETFLLDVSRGRIDLLRTKYQTRAREVVVLARVDVASAPHRNPDGEEIPCPHLHVYREGYADKWGTRIPPATFPNVHDAWLLLGDFLRFCNVTVEPYIDRDLFT